MRTCVWLRGQSREVTYMVVHKRWVRKLPE